MVIITRKHNKVPYEIVSYMIKLFIYIAILAVSYSCHSQISPLSENLKEKMTEIDSAISQQKLAVTVLIRLENGTIKKMSKSDVKNHLWPDSMSTSYDIYKNEKEEIISIVESPYIESGDWNISYQYYFDENGKTFAYTNFEGSYVNNCSGAEITRETITFFYNEYFNIVDSLHEMTDGKRSRLPDDCLSYNKNQYYATFSSVENVEKIIYSSTEPFSNSFGWHTYDGTLNNQKVRLSIFPNHTKNEFAGYYSAIDKPLKVYVDGYYYKGYILFRERNKKDGFYTGLYNDKKSTLIGSGKIDGKEILFDLTLSSITGGLRNNMYWEVSDDDNIVESFMQKVKDNILSKNAEWLSNNICYPITIFFSHTKTIKLQNKLQFMQNAGKILSEKFTNLIKAQPTFSLFAKNGAVYLGGGLVIIGKKSSNSSTFCINHIEIF
jgi:hypothetical protein